MRQRIGLYGGSFDPIHFGHLISARSIAEQLGLTKVILIPALCPPHKQDRRLSGGEHRLAMAQLAVEGDPLFEVSDVELRRPGPSYTIDTVSAFRQELGDAAEIFWIIGADSLPELRSWRKIGDLVRLAHLVTAARPGWQPPPVQDLARSVGEEYAKELIENRCTTPEIGISSTEIRARLAAGLSVRYLVPEKVASYITVKSLYRSQV